MLKHWSYISIALTYRANPAIIAAQFQPVKPPSRLTMPVSGGHIMTSVSWSEQALQDLHLQQRMQGAASSKKGDATRSSIPNPANVPTTCRHKQPSTNTVLSLLEVPCTNTPKGGTSCSNSVWWVINCKCAWDALMRDNQKNSGIYLWGHFSLITGRVLLIGRIQYIKNFWGGGGISCKINPRQDFFFFFRKT